MKHIWSLVVDRTTIDQVSNVLNLGNVIENIQVGTSGPEKPNKESGLIVAFNFEVVTYLTRKESSTKGQGSIKVSIEDPTDKILAEIDNKFEFPANTSRLRLRVQSNQLPVTTTGTYNFNVMLKTGTGNSKYEKVASIPVDVTLSHTS